MKRIEPRAGRRTSPSGRESLPASPSSAIFYEIEEANNAAPKRRYEIDHTLAPELVEKADYKIGHRQHLLHASGPKRCSCRNGRQNRSGHGMLAWTICICANRPCCCRAQAGRSQRGSLAFADRSNRPVTKVFLVSPHRRLALTQA
jgi:hypothetical protein